MLLRTSVKRPISESRIKQDVRPTFSQLSDLVLQLDGRIEHRIRVCWPNVDGEGELHLLVQTSGSVGEPSWELKTVAPNKTTSQWLHITRDALLIHNLIAISCGANENDLVQADGVISTSEAYRHSSKKTEDYYIPFNKSEAPPEVVDMKALFRGAEIREISPNATLTRKHVDQDLLNSVRMCLRDPQSGLHFYPALLYELEQEFIRSFRNKTSFSILLIRFGLFDQTKNIETPLDKNAFLWAARTIAEFKRASDIVAYYEHDVLCLLLPNTTQKGAVTFSKRLVKRITQAAAQLSNEPVPLRLHTGLASLPEECKDLGMLLAIAEASLATPDLKLEELQAG